MKLKQRLIWFFRGKSPGAQRARRVVRIVILLVLFGVLFWIIPFDQVLSAMLAADPLYFALGILFSFVTTVLTAAQLAVLVRKQQIKRGVGQVTSILFAAKFYNQFAPGGVVAGGVKWYRLAHPGGKGAEALAAMGFFRLMEIFIEIVVGLSFWLLSGQDIIDINVAWLVGLIFFITLVWILLTRYSLPIYENIKARGGQLWDRPAMLGIIKRFEKLLKAVSAYAGFSAWELFLAILAGVASLMAGVASNQFIAWSVGIEISFLDMGWINVVVGFLAQLPFAIAGGLGLREVSLVFMLSSFGISADLALAFSLLLFVRGIANGLVGGLIEAYRALRSKGTPEVDKPPNHLKET